MTVVLQVLLIDDDENSYGATCRLLARGTNAQYQLKWASSFEAGIAALREADFDVCMLNHQLGAKTGLDLLKHAISTGCGTPIILLTAQGDEAVDIEAICVGAADALKKENLDVPTLERSIGKAHERTRLLEEIASGAKLASIAELSGSIAHEISNPLTIVQGFARQLIQVMDVPEPDLVKARKWCSEIDAATSRISQIVRGLRTLGANSSADKLCRTSVHEIVEDATSMCRERFQSKGVRLRIGVINDTISVPCRRVQICQVLLNLLNNAFDAVEQLPERWVELGVESRAGALEISVTDSGRGIPAEIRAKVMKPFYTTKATGKGTGLGLSISRKIVEGHGGVLRIDNNCSNTRFVVSIPSSDASA